MRIRMPRLTYGNIVSTLALFIALGGVSYAAATLPKNSVGSAQLKKNAVTSKAIKDKTITGSDIKNGTLTGAKINAGSLGTVPFATSAGSAASSDQTTTPIVKRVGPSANNASSSAALAAATEVPLASNGSVSVYGKCYVSGSSLYAELHYKTTQNGAVSNISSGPSYYGSPYLDTSTTEPNRYIYSTSASTGSSSYMSSAYYGIGSVVGPDGNGLNFRLNMWVKNGDIIGGNGAFGVGQVCLFTGAADKVNLG